MNPFKNFDWSFKSIAKVSGMVILGMIVVVIALSLISFAFKTILGANGNLRAQSSRGFGGIMNVAMDMDDGYYAESEMAYSSKGMAMSMPPNVNVTPTGSDAEDYEVHSYNGSIRSRNLDKTCGVISKLKAKDYIIFTSSDKNENNCYYSFKVAKDNTKEVVNIIEDLDPEYFNANIQTIKGSLKKYDSELDILAKKLSAIETTLEEAQEAYDEVNRLARRMGDTETLASVIKSKLELIEKLSRERLSVKERIDRFERNKSDQLDRLNYSFFSVSVSKDVIFDWKEIKDSWKYELKELVRSFNEFLQDVSLHLVTYVISVVEAVIYIFLSVFLLKFVWIGMRKIWKGDFCCKVKKRRK